MSATPIPRIFITHSWKDIEFARRLHSDLKAHGLDVWFDDRTLRPGHRVAEEINRGLEWCDFYIPVVSQASLASPWCWEEINAAITLSNQPNRQRPLIIPAIAEDCSIPALLSSRLYVSFFNRYDDALRELLEKAFGLQSQVVAVQVEAPPAQSPSSQPIAPPAAPPASPPPTLPSLPVPVLEAQPTAPPRSSRLASRVITALAVVIVILLLMLSTGTGALIARVGGINAAATWIAALQRNEPKFPTTVPAANPIFPASSSSSFIAPTSVPTLTPRPTATAVPSPTSAPFIPAPIATDRPTSTPAPTATPAIPPGFYAMSIRVAVPTGLRNGQPQTFFVTFFNNTSRTITYKWFLKIFEPNAKNSLGDTPKVLSEFPPGFNRESSQSTSWTKFGPGPCVNYTARVWIWFDDNPNAPQEFAKPDGTSPSVVFPVNCN